MGGDDFGEEQIVLFVIARLRQQAAFEPGDTPLEQRRFNLVAAKGLQAIGLKLVLPLALGDFQTRSRTDGLHDIGLIDARNVEYEGAGRLEQLPRPGGFVEDDGDFRRFEVQWHRPGGGHDVALAVMGGADQYGRAVIEQTVGFVQGNRAAV